MGYVFDIKKKIGSRVSDLTLLATGKKIDAAKTDVVGGWAAVNETAEGPKVYDLASTYIRRQKVVRFDGSRAVRVIT